LGKGGKMNAGNILYLLLPLWPILVIILVFGIALYYKDKKYRFLKNLSNYFKGYIPKFYIGYPCFKGEYNGLNFSITTITPRGKFCPPEYLAISISKSSFLKLSIYNRKSTPREGVELNTLAIKVIFTGLEARLGMVHEVKTNDETFDHEFFISSNEPTQAASFLNNPTVKNTIKELFDNGFVSFCIDGKQILIKKPNYILEKDL
jgi:hypothetical protein